MRLAQVFTNLLTNAAKYTNPGGQIDVSLECSSAEYVVRVRDTGIGISAEMLKNAFKLSHRSPIRYSVLREDWASDCPWLRAWSRCMADMLGGRAHQAQMAHDGLAAVAAASEMKPDVILLDIGLPGQDGYEVARRIRAMKDIGASTVLIALTGWGQESDKQQGFQAGFDLHLLKPVGIHQLKEALDL